MKTTTNNNDNEIEQKIQNNYSREHDQNIGRPKQEISSQVNLNLFHGIFLHFQESENAYSDAYKKIFLDIFCFQESYKMTLPL